jgi:hypothetical protein
LAAITPRDAGTALSMTSPSSVCDYRSLWRLPGLKQNAWHPLRAIRMWCFLTLSYRLMAGVD